MKQKSGIPAQRSIMVTWQKGYCHPAKMLSLPLAKRQHFFQIGKTGGVPLKKMKLAENSFTHLPSGAHLKKTKRNAMRYTAP